MKTCFESIIFYRAGLVPVWKNKIIVLFWVFFFREFIFIFLEIFVL